MHIRHAFLLQPLLLAFTLTNGACSSTTFDDVTETSLHKSGKKQTSARRELPPKTTIPTKSGESNKTTGKTKTPKNKPVKVKPRPAAPAVKLPVLARSELVLEWQLKSLKTQIMMKLNGAWKQADKKTVAALRRIKKRNDRIVNSIMLRNASRAAVGRPGRESFTSYLRVSVNAKHMIKEIEKTLRKAKKNLWQPNR